MVRGSEIKEVVLVQSSPGYSSQRGGVPDFKSDDVEAVPTNDLVRPIDKQPFMAKSFSMSKVRVQCFAVSIDGYGAGPNQDLQNPLGVRGPELMDSFFHTRVWRKMHGYSDGETGVDNEMAEQAFVRIGAWILGRNMFGPIRGPWPDENWKGWWGEEPPYHTPVFVLTHHPRKSFRMRGGTEFHFVTDGIAPALQRAREAAGNLDVRVGGGVSTVRQYLQAGLIDEMHVPLRPMLMGKGEHLWQGLDLHALGYECTRTVAGERATHLFFGRKPFSGGK